MSGEATSPSNQAKTSRRSDEEDMMRGALIPLLGAIGAGVFFSAFTPSPDAPNDVYGWRWTIDTVPDAQKKASRWEATFPTTAPDDPEGRSCAGRDPSSFPFGGT
jgi:hypothetical protein